MTPARGDPRTMLGLQSRPSDSPYVERVWRSEARGGVMTSVAASRTEIVFWWAAGALRVAVRGPETVAWDLDVPPGHRSYGIVLAHGAVLRPLPAIDLVDTARECEHVTRRGVVLGGDEVAVPTYDTAEGFVQRLVRRGLLVRDPLVDDVLAGGATRLSRRSVERRVRGATGLTRGAVDRIERARQAAILLGDGVAPRDVVGWLGYHDHPHLARSLARFIGHGASELPAPRTSLSLLYPTDGPPGPT